MPNEMSKKKSCVGDPSWKVHFQNMSEMQVLRTFRVEKRATPSKGPSLVLELLSPGQSTQFALTGQCMWLCIISYKVMPDVGIIQMIEIQCK